MENTNTNKSSTLKKIKDNIIKGRELQKKYEKINQDIFSLLDNLNINIEVENNAENADDLEQAINCYMTYGEFSIEGIMNEIQEQLNRKGVKHMSDVQLNSHGINSKIKANILPDEQMRKIGFVDLNKKRWYFYKDITNFEITFNVSIPKDGSDINIDVLDEDFLQPYDYQHFLYNNPSHNIALQVKEKVEEWMKYLQDNGVLEGHKYGEYI